MDAKHIWRLPLAGGLSGLANGLFGGGGGMVFVPLVSGGKTLSPRQVFATCVGVMYPICLVSAGVYWYQGHLPLAEAAPYLAGGFLGGLVGGKLYGKVSTTWLRRIFALFLLYGGVRYVW